MVAEAVTGAPAVEDLHTRAIEDRSILRGFVRSTEVRDHVAHGITLRTVDVVRIRYVPDSADVEEGERDLGIVVGSLTPPTDVQIDGTTIRTPAMVVEVDLRPFHVTISTLDGVER